MKTSPAMICLLFVASTADAQINPRALTLSGMSDCLKDAISVGSIEDDGPMVVFSCTGVKARTLYNFLGRKIRAEVVHDRNGKFENRQFGANACYHRVEDQNGKAADDFRCDLMLTIGEEVGD